MGKRACTAETPVILLAPGFEREVSAAPAPRMPDRVGSSGSASVFCDCLAEAGTPREAALKSREGKKCSVHHRLTPLSYNDVSSELDSNSLSSLRDVVDTGRSTRAALQSPTALSDILRVTRTRSRNPKSRLPTIYEIAGEFDL
eukprot:CAMPEP_0185829712 /NCGR_PEP_ID=MMETSP1353-20130828/408_1 /TAXON_ID=1077150 /ORGANISM="Erythrolobus australicus, Strain CCMP3124" /LENGTH=143 /DNA_ID=CAMNT_0028527531 /DNA_START=97 /DNA_END=528 /DNA_ORIENTATION=-